MVPSRRTIYQPVLCLLLALPAAASTICAPCHPKHVRGFAGTGMGQSLGRPRDHPEGSVYHSASGSRFTIRRAGSGMRHRLERAGFAAEYDVAYFLGSGHMGRSYLVRIGDHLFQSPVSYYSGRRAWDLSPGYERDRHPDFNRPVTAECLFCHAGRARPVKGTLNRYEDPPFSVEAISCDRCHGPAEAHAAKPSAGNIVNPAKLSPRARDSVCEQCHLGGEARIPNPGAEFDDFQPGRDLEEVFTVFVYAGSEGTRRVVSHSEQLARSACARASGTRMWCGSCHDPHEKPADPKRYYTERCLSCHKAGLGASHPAKSEDCAGCHMPRRIASDVAHTAVTDHQILRRPSTQAASGVARELAAWREPPRKVARRNLGLAYIGVGERDQSAFHLNEGFRLLASELAAFPGDPAVLTGLGLVFLRKNAPAEALGVFERALKADPSRATHHLNLAVALSRAGRPEEAVERLNRAIELDPALEEAYQLLALIYEELQEPEKRRQTLERFLRFMPQSIQARRLAAQLSK